MLRFLCQDEKGEGPAVQQGRAEPHPQVRSPGPLQGGGRTGEGGQPRRYPRERRDEGRGKIITYFRWKERKIIEKKR